ncbi:hypothetical protein B0O80DRAFT_434597 [Mortierella sp. GBAus27b]|nr:hypothetical protein B0O80DRAFT_434597 [Mortierella sp. GBAus27b]
MCKNIHVTMDKNRKTQKQERIHRHEQGHTWTGTGTYKDQYRTTDKNMNMHVQEHNYGQEQLYTITKPWTRTKARISRTKASNPDHA